MCCTLLCFSQKHLRCFGSLLGHPYHDGCEDELAVLRRLDADVCVCVHCVGSEVLQCVVAMRGCRCDGLPCVLSSACALCKRGRVAVWSGHVWMWVGECCVVWVLQVSMVERLRAVLGGVSCVVGSQTAVVMIVCMCRCGNAALVSSSRPR